MPALQSETTQEYLSRMGIPVVAPKSEETPTVLFGKSRKKWVLDSEQLVFPAGNEGIVRSASIRIRRMGDGTTLWYGFGGDWVGSLASVGEGFVFEVTGCNLDLRNLLFLSDATADPVVVEVLVAEV